LFKNSAKLKETVDFVVATDSHSEALVCSEAQSEAKSGLEAVTTTPLVIATSTSTYLASQSSSLQSSGENDRGKRPLWHSTAQRFAIASIMLGSVLSYYLLHFLAGHFFWHFSGVQTTEYMHATTDASCIGLVVTLFCYAEFLRGFLDFKHSMLSVFVRAMAAGLVIVLGAMNGGVGGAIIAVLCCLLCLSMGQVARWARLAIPPTFRAGRAVLVAAAASIPATALSGVAFYQAITNPPSTDYPSIYTPSSCGDELGLGIALFFFLAVPAYAFVRCARTSEMKPLVALGLLQVSPLAVGFLAQLAVLAPRDGGLAMFGGGLISLAMGCALVASGSAIGAAVNGMKHRRKMTKAGI